MDILADTQSPPEDHSEENDRHYKRPPGWGRNADGTGPGKQKGSSAKQRAQYRLKYAIQNKGPQLVKRLFTIANCRDYTTAVSAIRLLLAYGWGRPTIHVEVDGTIKKRYMAVMPPTLEHHEWMKMIQGQTHSTTIIDTHNGQPLSSNGNTGK